MYGSLALAAQAAGRAAGPVMVQAQVVAPAPTSFSQSLVVAVTGWLADRTLTITDWPASHGSTLPQVGSVVVLGIDDNRRAWCVMWAAPYTAPPATGTAGGDLAGSFPNPTVAKSSAGTFTANAIAASTITANQGGVAIDNSANAPASATVDMYDTQAAAGAKRARLINSRGTTFLQAVNDAYSAAATALSFPNSTAPNVSFPFPLGSSLAFKNSSDALATRLNLGINRGEVTVAANSGVSVTHNLGATPVAISATTHFDGASPPNIGWVVQSPNATTFTLYNPTATGANAYWTASL